MLSLQLLGVPIISNDGQIVSVARRKSRALLYYVAADSAPVAREAILGLFWPDHDRAAAQQILRTSLHGLRKALGAALLVRDDTLALAADVDVDLRNFEAALAQPANNAAALAATLARYRGDFVSGFSVPDAEPFEEWLDAQRERLRQLARRGLLALASLYEDRHDYGAAQEVLTRALSFNLFQEDIQRALMRVQYRAGDRAGAIRRYEQLSRLLDDELGVPPMDETRALYDAIITDSVPTNHGLKTPDERPQAVAIAGRAPRAASPVADQLPFIGRDAELRRLHELSEARKLALIEGEPGIGKTRLANTFLASFGGLALAGAARELEQTLPYQPIIEALRGLIGRDDWPSLRTSLDVPAIWLTEVARLLPELADTAPVRDDLHVALPASLRPMDESRLWEGVAQLLLALARQQPVALLLDDLHWADASTLALLAYLVRQTASVDVQPLVFVATVRLVQPRSPLAALVQTLTREERLGRLPLARLSADDTVALARHLSPTYAFPLADWLVHNAEGNPYILVELVRYARSQGMLRADGVLNLSALSDVPVVPGAIYSLIQSRIEQLSDAARRVLTIAVAIGRAFDLAVVARASGLPELVLLDAMDELRATGLVLPNDTDELDSNGLHFVFDHSLTMEVVYREVGEARHRLAHRLVAEAIEQLHQADLDAVAGLLASHFAEGGVPERAASYAFRAGQRAADLSAWAEAIAFFQQALAGAANGQRTAIMTALGEAFFQSGQSLQSAEAFRKALDLALTNGKQDEADAIRLLMGGALIGQARFADAIALAQEVLAHGRDQFVVGAELLWGTALSIEGVDLEGAGLHLARAESCCAAQANPAVLAQITFERGSVAAQRGALVEAVALYRESLAVAEANPVAAAYRVLANNNLGYHLMLLGDPAARSYAERSLAVADEIGMLGFQTFARSTLGEIALAAGDVDEAERQFHTGLQMAERLDYPERIAGLTANLGLVAMRRGQKELAIQRLSAALAQADGLGIPHLAASIRIWLAPLLPLSEARATLAQARTLAESGGRTLLLAEIDRLEAQL